MTDLIYSFIFAMSIIQFITMNVASLQTALLVTCLCLSLYRVIELTGDVTPDMRAIAQADLIVTTPEKWDGVSRSWQNRSYVQKVAILIIDEIHLLGKDTHLFHS